MWSHTEPTVRGLLLIQRPLHHHRHPEGHFPDVGLWTSPERTTTFVRALATGRFDALRDGFLDAREELEERIEAIISGDLNPVRL